MKNGAKWSLRSKTKSSASAPGTSPVINQNQRKASEKVRDHGTNNHTLANSMPAVHIRTQDMLSPLERQFLDAAEKGNRPTLEACLQQRSRIPLKYKCHRCNG
ncbi:Transient-receptor-potential-like protein [Meloidogyne graminicola]|uniref:Transient-receptor-potential-like protein n=1 Tax=Meloidogyne graminicola TaxID=189291 RepID=A0A8S9Z7K8_9BILA|nr:Transient-receptor-potential-like protein [Meloidogyne graminicola]